MFNNAPALEHQDLVCVLHCRQAVRNDKNRAASEEAIYRFLHEALRLGIKR
jgi:hypothetical protein